MSRRYQINRLWNGIAPILTTNLIEAGVIEAAANESLTLAAVTAFDRYTNSSLTSTTAAQEVDSSPTNKRRRRRRPSFQDKQSADDLLTNKESSAAPTPNDNFFEYQRRMGYTLDNNQSDDLLRQQLKDTHIIDAIIYYLQHFHVDDDKENNSSINLPQQRLVSSAIHALQSDSPEVTVDLWATVQRGEGSHHKFHVHEGAVVSGVYYSNCPLGCAPLVLRRPSLDSGNNLDNNDVQDIDDGRERDNDEEIHPNNGQLVLFPPWLNHGVPIAKEQQRDESSASLPRVSWAFNLNARLAYVGNAWDVTRPSLAR